MSFLRACALGAAALACLTASSGPTLAQRDRDGQQRWINVQNGTRTVIREFYMTDRDTNSWGSDLLGSGVINPGQQMRVLPSQRQRQRGYCVFDMRVVFADNSRVEARNVNLCEASALVCQTTSRCTAVR